MPLLSVLSSLLVIGGGSLHGTVRSKPSGEPLAYALVELPALHRRAVADPHGYYALVGIPPGRRVVRVSAPGHETREDTVLVREGEETALDVELARRAVTLGGLEVVADRRRGQERAGPGATIIDQAEIAALPALADPDVLRTVQTLPAVAAASDFSTALYVRGGAPDQTLVTLDGAPLFNPYHLAGLFSAIDPDAVASVAVLPGALPASAGDRLSGLVDIRTRDGARDRVRSSGAVGLLTARATVDGPLPWLPGTFLVSARRTYLDLLTSAAHQLGLLSGDLPYAFWDGHLKATFPVGQGGRLVVSGYRERDGFQLPERWEVGNAAWGWGSDVASASLRAPAGTAVLAEASAGISRFRGVLDSLDPAEASSGSIARTSAVDGFATLRLTHYGVAHEQSAGLQLDRYAFSHAIDASGSGLLSQFLPAMQRSSGLTSIALYASDRWTPLHDVRVDAGVRVLAAPDHGAVWMPRLGVRWTVSPALILTLGAGRYEQVVQSLRDEESIASSIFAYDLLMAVPAGRALPTADDVVAGIEWTGGATSVRVEAYAKRFRKLVLPPLPANPRESPALASGALLSGRGEARGVETTLRHAGKRHQAWVSYALAFDRRTVAGESYQPHYARRHTLDLGLATALGTSGKAAARFSIASGQPYTPAVSVHEVFVLDPATGQLVGAGRPVVLGPHNSEHLPPYVRLDLSVRKSFRSKWLGRNWTITPYVQVINALARTNAFWASPSDTGRRPELQFESQLPLLPTLGCEWRF